VTELVLWDIDHTLIENSGTSKAIYLAAFERLAGTPARVAPVTEGRTDRLIMHDLFESSGIPKPDWAEIEESLVVAGQSYSAVLRQTGWVLPGVTAAILSLTQVSNIVVQGLLTGNIRQNAEIKLAAFGLDRLLDFELGAYGADDDDRSRLVAIAQQRAKARTGRDFSGRRTILVGDTPRDVQAARFSGSRIIAVASGSYSMTELAIAGADITLPDLRDTDGFVASVLAECKSH
jgi:phosphoglycolate phosphatase-like HAD superfamily hydrolase